MCWFDNWGNFYNWNNWSNAQVTPTANPDNQVTDGAAFDPTLTVAASVGGTSTGQFYSVTFTVTTPEAGDSFFLDLTNTGFTQVGNKIFYGSIELATVSGGEDGSPFVITPAATVNYGHHYRAGLIGELVDAVRFSNGGAAESGSETITITSSTSSGTTVVNVPMTYVDGVSAPGVGFDLTGGLATAGPAQGLDHTGLNAIRSSITALADGGYVLVWQSSGGANGYDIHGQRYDAAGQAVGEPFTVNSYVTSDQQLPQVSALADGGFVVVWQSNGQDGASYGVYGQRYGADGLPDGAEFQANTTTDQSEGNQAVVGLADGGFVVLWQTHDGVSAYVTRGQWYDADGVAQGTETTLVTTGQSEGIQQATALADGGMAMLSMVYTGSQYELRLYMFDGAGAAIGSPTVVHTGYLGEGTRDITALEGGGFAVSWFENGEINVRVFDDTGAAIGDLVTLAAASNLNSLSITDLANGGFVVSWQMYVDNVWQIFAQAFGADGQADGGVVSVSPGQNANTYPGRQSIDQLADGTIVVTWTWNGDVYTRELDFSEPALQTTEDGHGIPITLTGWDSDGSETLTVTLSGMPAGATFNQGEAGPDDTWVIEGADADALLGLQMTGPAHYTGAFTLTVSVVSVESGDGSTSSSTHEVDVVVSVNASTPTIHLDREGGAFSNPGEVDTYAGAGAQAGSAAHPDGGFVVVNFQAGTNAVQVHRFGADGEPIGGAVVISSDATAKSSLSIAVGADGAYMVTWYASANVYGVFVDSAGVAGPVFAVDDAVNAQQHPQAIAVEGGGFLVVWSSTGDLGIRGQLYDAGGQAQGDMFAIGTDYIGDPTTNYDAYWPNATVLEDGRILVVWQEQPSGVPSQVRGQLLAADGTPQGGEFTLQSDAAVHAYYPEVVGLSDGGWVLSWSENNQVHAQRYDANGEPVGPEFAYAAGLTSGSPITALPDGGYVLQWYASDDTLYAQRFDFQGEAIGGVLTVGRGGPGYASAAVVLDGDTLAFVYNFGSTGQVKTFDFAAYGISGHEDGPIAIPIELTWPDAVDGSETLTVTLSGFPEGATFSQGAAGPDGTWVIEVADPADLANLTMAMGPTATAGSFTLAISATTVESADGSTSTTEFVTDVTVEAGASDIDLSPPDGEPFTAPEGEPIATPIALTWPDQDGSETLTVTLSGFPAGATFSQGAAGDGGTWVIEVADPADLLTLTMTAPADFTGDFLLDVAATAVESANGDTASDSLSIQVTVTAEASQPELEIDGAALVIEAAGPLQTVGTGYQFRGGTVEFADGGFGVLYVENQLVFMQRFDADGSPEGSPEQINSTSGSIYQLTHTALEGGGYMLAYVYSSGGPYVETYDADGVLVNGPVTVTSGTSYSSSGLTALPDGGAVLVWMDYTNDGGYTRTYMAQELDASGEPTGPAVRMPAPPTGWATGDVLVATRPDGSVVVGFTYTPDGVALNAMLTGLDADGQPFAASVDLGTGRLESLTALADGSIVALNSGSLIVLDSDLEMVGAPIALGVTNGQVFALSDGGFVVAGYFNGGMSVQRYDADGDAVGDPFTSPGYGYAVELLEMSDGSLVASWTTSAGRITEVIDYSSLLNGAEDAAVAVALDLTWPDQDGSETMTVTLSGFPEGATFSQGEAGDGGTWVIEVTDPADLLDLTMTPPADWSGSFDLTVTATTEESANGDTASDSQTVTIEVASVNDAPEVTAPASISVTEDTGTAVTGITVADVDSAGLTVTLSVASGALAATSGNGVIVGGSASALTLTGSATDINAFIAASSVTFTPAANSDSDVTLGVGVSDGALSDTAEVTLDLQPVNDAPLITGAPASVTVTEDTATAVTGVTVADIDSASLTVTLAVASGSLSATSGSGVTVGGTASALTLTGSAADINAFIAASEVSFTPAVNATADVNLDVTVSDGALDDAASVNLDVTAVNDAPEITAPASISGTEDTATAVTGVSVADVDSASLTVTLTVASGALSATSGGGVTVGGEASALTLTGSAGDINAFIAASGVMFTPAPDSEADVTLGVSVTDGALSDQQDVTIDVQPVNDAPFITAAATGEVLENNASVITGVTVGDIDSASLTLTLTASSGTLAAADGSGVTVSGSGTGVLELSGSSADLNAFIAAGAVTFLTQEDSEADVTLTATVSDGDLEASADTTFTVLPDSIDGTEGDDPLEGTEDDDTMRGFGGDDAIDGGAGDDVIEGGEGDDTLTGGEGADTFVFRAGDGVDTITDPSAEDTIVIYGYTSYTIVTVDRETRIMLDADNYIVITQAPGVPSEGLPQIVLAPYVQEGGSGDDDLTGTPVLDELRGMDGDDVLIGGGGNDVLDGGTGVDTTNGGLGNDHHYVDNAGDTVVEAAGEGNDRVLASVSYALAAGAEIELFTTTGGSADINLTGNEFGQTLVGNAGANVLSGGGGDDVMRGNAGIDTTSGGLGNDLHYVDSASDTVIESFGQGTGDRVLASTSYALSLGAEVEIMTTQNSAGTTAINLTGNVFNQLIVGNAGANILDGGAGADTLRGLDGADVLIGGSGDDLLTGGAGADQFWFNAGGFGADTVTDFQNGVDQMRASGIDRVNDFSDLTVTSNGAGWAVVTFPDGSTVTLTGVLATDVDASDFVFGG